MNQELALSIGLPTKNNIYQAAMNIVEQCKNGEINPLELAVKLSALEKIIETIREGVSEDVLAELDKENGKTTMLSAKIQRKEVGVKYDYSEIPVIEMLKNQEGEIANRRKQFEKVAQTIPEGTEAQIADEVTGEIFTVKRAAKTSKTSFSVTLSNE